MRALLETLPLPVILRDTERRVTLVNAALEKMFGIPREDIVGKPLDDDPQRHARPTITANPTTKLLAERKSLRYETVDARSRTERTTT